MWASASGATLLSTGGKSVSVLNNNSTNLLVSLFMPLTNAVLTDLNNGFNVYFASATCGNDEISGNVPGVPEPGTWAMIGSGLVALGFYRRKS